MSLRTKQVIIALLAFTFLASLIFVQWMEVARKAEEAGLTPQHVAIPADSQSCVNCHQQSSPGIIDHWTGSTHAAKGVGCVSCHQAQDHDADAFEHYGHTIATVVTPLDCSRCHTKEADEFAHSHHAKAGNILASLDNFLAETVEGSREPFTPFNPHAPAEFTANPASRTTSGMMVNGMASVNVGCKQCHGSKIALEDVDGGMITADDLQPDADGKPTNLDALARIKKNANGQPQLHTSSWPNTGIGRINLDGSLGSCSACHSRHDFSPRRARQPENCGKCHLGPDHPQKEIYEESKHGVAFRDLKDHMKLDGESWVLGKDYTQAPTCATCHMSGHTRNGGKVTHDPGERISWTNRPPVSVAMDTDINGVIVTETDPAKRAKLVAESWETKRERMKNVCTHCHTNNYVNAFYGQYDDFVINYNEKFAKPGAAIMKKLYDTDLITSLKKVNPKTGETQKTSNFDEEIEWTWFYLWHHEGRRARHGAAMMAPDYAHWHGMYEVAERFYIEFIPQAREIAEHAKAAGDEESGDAVLALIERVLEQPEHQWYEQEKKKKLAAETGGPEETKPAGDKATEDESAEDTTGGS